MERDRQQRPDRHRATDERGATLLIALMATLLLTALSSGMVLLTTTETAISANYRAAQEAMYAADAGIERVVQDLLTVPQWDGVLTGQVLSAFVDVTTSPTLADGSPLDLSEETIALQQATDAANIWGPNDPVWRLYAYGALEDLLPGAVINSANYIAVWASDDAAETDGDPQRDANGVLTVRSEAFGPFNTRRVVEATVARSTSTATGRGLTGQRGEGALNQRSRESAVETPGGQLARSQMNTGTGGMVVQ